MESKKKKNITTMRNQIACRNTFEDFYKAVDLPRMIFQIYPWDRDSVLINLRRQPREIVQRFSFKMNINLFVGFLIFASEMLYISNYKEQMTPEKRVLLLSFLFSGSIIHFLLLELSLSIPGGLSREEQNWARLVGYLQEVLMVIVLVPILYWVLQEPAVLPVALPT